MIPPIIDTESFICDCNSFEHQIKFIYDREDDLLYTYIYLKPGNLLKRLKRGVRYILGHSSIYGEWDEFRFKSSDEKALSEFLLKIKREREGDLP